MKRGAICQNIPNMEEQADVKSAPRRGQKQFLRFDRKKKIRSKQAAAEETITKVDGKQT